MDVRHQPLPLQPRRTRLSLPLAGERVAAGFPSPADDYVEVGIDLNDQLIRHPTSTFFLRVSGESMLGAGIHDGDLLVVDRSLDPRPGRVVVAVLDGEFTLKRLVQHHGRLRLEVVQCVGLKVHGLELPLEDASPVELCCSAGAEVLTTSDHRSDQPINRKHAGRAFEWQPSAYRAMLEAAQTTDGMDERVTAFPFDARPPRCEQNECVFTGSTCVLQGGRELPDDAMPAPGPRKAKPLTCKVLSRTHAVVPLEW